MHDLHRVTVVGAGRVGRAVADRLVGSGRYAVRLAAPHIRNTKLQGHKTLDLCPLDASAYSSQLRQALLGAQAVVCATPDFATPAVAAMARELGCHYLDLSETDPWQRGLHDVAHGATCSFIPGCGLAPGLITTWAADCAERFGPEASITAYVGVLPLEPLNRMGYANLWGIDGLISEYTKPCRVIRGGEIRQLMPLSELENMQIDGRQFEAFNTAGSLDALLEPLQHRVRDLQFKTLRYPGHWDYMQFLLQDMGLHKRPSSLKSLLSNALPPYQTDRVVMCMEVRTGPLSEVQYRQVFHLISVADPESTGFNAVTSLSADHVCAALDLLMSSPLPQGLLLPHTLGWSTLQQSKFMTAFFEPLLAP